MNNNISIVVEAKNFYQLQLCKLLNPCIYDGILTIWAICREESKTPLRSFQEKLTLIPVWNQLTINDEYNRIQKKAECDYFDKILDAIFICNSKILLAIGNKPKTIDINVPNPKNFLHSCYISSARNFWKNPYLFEDRENRMSYYKRKKNIIKCENIINKSIIETIEDFIPIEALIKSYFNESGESNETEDSDESVIADDTTNDPSVSDDLPVPVLPVSDLPENDTGKSDSSDNEDPRPSLDVLQGNTLYDSHRDNLFDSDDDEEEEEEIKHIIVPKYDTERMNNDSREPRESIRSQNIPQNIPKYQSPNIIPEIQHPYIQSPSIQTPSIQGQPSSIQSPSIQGQPSSIPYTPTHNTYNQENNMYTPPPPIYNNNSDDNFFNDI